ncbi:GyrI-like domain-containing protein [Rugamonas sp.]|uniref:AraC family transcriptional regulator n=1 Tax=Rugamonas sp. TaxID=1926287 RepID=UPI0025F7E7F9|nr:GyrI-like domain-containing protein [Rugamonas sp.]
MEVQVIDIAEVHVAYLRYKGPFGAAIGAFWSEIFNPWRAAHGLERRVTYGVAQDDPCSTPAAECRYDACVEVDADYEVKPPVKLAQLAGGRYAVAAFRGTGADMPAAWTEFFGNWLPTSGLTLDGRPCFERYGADHAADPQTGAFSCELCLPVK